ncbi:MAG: hypothetical protein DMD35_12205 [Gemmatimonadetes bacterium]|nr:MAG: hypothetical protein DMD35_12205 [Gemmatimonadota bacterium]
MCSGMRLKLLVTAWDANRALYAPRPGAHDCSSSHSLRSAMITLPRCALTALSLACLAVSRDAAAQAQPQSPLAFAASSFASTEVHLNSRRIGGEWYAEDASLTGPSRIAIVYGQPHARGRKIEGGLVPLDTVWRFGANSATTLHTDVDLTLGTLAVPRGDYALFLLYSRTGWQLIVNTASAAWGTDYDAKRDVGRTVLSARTRSEPEESLTIYLVPEATRPRTGLADLRGRLRIVWGTTELSTTWSVAR